MRREIRDPRIISGFFKEAIFHKREILMQVNESAPVRLQVFDVVESSARSKNAERHVTLETVEGTWPVTSNIKKLICNFPHFVAEWEITHWNIIQNGEPTLVTFPLPESVQITDRRRSRRTETQFLETIEMPVVVQNKGIYTEGSLKIENISTQGIGGVLKLFAPIPIEPGATVSGKTNRANGSMRIHSKIMKATVNPDALTFRVGLQQDLAETSGKQIWNGTNRRRSARVNTKNHSIECTSPFHARHRITFNLVNASVTGFSATLRDQTDRSFLPLGCAISINGNSLLGEIISIEDDLFRIELIGGNSEDRLHWLKSLSQFQQTNVHTSIAVGSDLLELFCEAGAVSPSFLKRQAEQARQILTNLGNTTDGDAWIHRWIEKGEDGQIHAHIAGIQIADTVWHLGDLAGLFGEKEFKADFVKNFLRTFGEYLASSPQHTVALFGWKSGHPYWRAFEDFCLKQSSTNAFTFNYFRLGTQLNQEQGVSVRKIRPSELQGSAEKRNQYLKAYEGSELLERLDFNPFSFGSPYLSRITKNPEGKPFFELTLNSKKFIATQTHLPHQGSSLLQTASVWFLFKQVDAHLEATELDALSSTIALLTKQNGASGVGFFLIQDHKTTTAQVGTSQLTYCLIDPLSLIGATEVL